MAVKPQQMVSDWFCKATEALDTALKTSAKFQEETMQWWAEMMGGANSIQDWQKRAQSMALEAIPTAQKNAEEYMHAMDQTYRTGLDLLRRAFEGCECHSMEDLQGRVQSLWETTLGALRTNTQAFVQANAKAMESWAELVRRSTKSAMQQAQGAMRQAEHQAEGMMHQAEQMMEHRHE